MRIIIAVFVASVLLTMLTCSIVCAADQPVGTSFTYQGRLTDIAGAPLSGSFDLSFKLFDSVTDGTQIGVTVNLTGVSMTGGIFTVQLDFGQAAFSGFRRWIEVGVGGQTLTPRIEVTSTPGAIYAMSVPWSDIVGAPAALPPSGPAGGDLVGAYPAPAIADNAVTTAKIADASVTGAKLAPGFMSSYTGSIQNLASTTANPLVVGSVSMGFFSHPDGVVVAGRYAYVPTASGDFSVMDVSKPAQPSIIGTCTDYASAARGIAVAGRYAYVGYTTIHSVKVVDVSRPASPTVVGQVNIGGAPFGMAVSGRYVFAVCYDTLAQMRIIDVADPTGPVVVGSVATGANPICVTVSGRYAYVVNQAGNTMQIIDVSNPTTPVVVSTIATGASPTAVAVSGRYAYVANEASKSLQVFDVSNPTAPSSIGSVNIGGYCNAIALCGRYACVTNWEQNKMHLIDVSTPTSPVSVGATSIDRNPHFIAASGRYVYVTAYDSDALQVLDIGGIETTSLMAHSAEAGILQVRGSAVVGNQLNVGGGLNVGLGGILSNGSIAANGAVRSTAGGFEFPDGSVQTTAAAATAAAGGDLSGSYPDPAVVKIQGHSVSDTTPTDGQVLKWDETSSSWTPSDGIGASYSAGSGLDLTGTVLSIPDLGVTDAMINGVSWSKITGAPTGSTPSGPAGGDLAGTYPDPAIADGAVTSSKLAAGALSSYTGNIQNLASTIANPVVVGSVDTEGYPMSIAVLGRRAYVAKDTSDNLQIIDLSNPASPVVTGSVGTGNRPRAVAASGVYAYVVNFSSNTLQVVNASDPANPAVVGSVGTDRGPISVAVSGRYAFITNYDSNTLQVIDVSNPSSPAVIGSSYTGTWPVSVAISGRYAYIGCIGASTLEVVDISDPTNPVEVGAASGIIPASVIISGRYAYVGNHSMYCMQIVDISNPFGPVVVSRVGTGGTCMHSVAVSGRYAFVAGETSRKMQVVDVSDPASPIVVGSVDTDDGRSIAASGRYVYLAGYNSNTLQVIDIGGIETTSLTAHSAEAGILQVLGNAGIGNQLSVGGGLNVGPGGILSNGGIAANGAIRSTAGGFQFPDGSVQTTAAVPMTAAGGDLAGTYPNPTIAAGKVDADKIASGAVTDSKIASVSYVKITGAPASLPPSGTAGGDLTGTYPDPAVAKLQGRSVSDAAPGDGQVLKWDETSLAWTPSDGGGAMYSAGSGLSLSGTVFSIPDLGVTDAMINGVSWSKVTGAPTGSAPSGPAGGDLAGTYPDPTIADGAVTSSKLAAGALSGYAGNIQNLASTSANPVVAGSIGLSGSPSLVRVSGRYAYVAVSPGIQVIDVSDPSNPTAVGSVATGSGVSGIAVSGRYAYMTVSKTLQVIDVSNPASPSVVGSVATGDNPGEVAVAGRYVYVMERGSVSPYQPSMAIIDVSNPAAPSLVTRYWFLNEGWSMRIAVSGRYAYVAGGYQLRVMDISNPANPVPAGALFSLPDLARSITVSGRYAYVAGSYYDTVQVIDISNVQSPSVVGSVATDAEPLALAISGRYLCVADATNRARVIDVLDPHTPTIVGSVVTGSNPCSVAVSGRYGYITDSGVNTLQVIDIGGIETTSLVAHSAEAGTLQVRSNAAVGNQLSVGGGLNIGAGGLFSDGNIATRGNIYCTSLTNASARSLKENIRPISGALERVMALQGVSFDWKPELGGKSDIGLIAEDVGRVVPEVVDWAADGKEARGLDYSHLTALTIEAIKDQQKQIEAQQREIGELKAQLAALIAARKEEAEPPRASVDRP